MNPAPRPPTPEEARVIEDQQRRLAEVRRFVPRGDPPYCAHLQIQTERGKRDILLGERSLLEGGLTIVDWRKAPLADLFFAHQPGEEYELEIGDRLSEGVVLARHRLHFEREQLVQISVESGELILGEHGHWEHHPHGDTTRPSPRPASARRGRGVLPGEAPLDDAQRAGVELDPSTNLLVLGEAGFGKTTVALHRVAHLVRSAREEARSFRVLVLLPTEGLRRLTRALLSRLGLSPGRDVEIDTFEEWVGHQAREVFERLPDREAIDPDPAITRLKRHPALRTVLPRVAEGTPDMRAAGWRRRAEVRRSELLHLFGDRRLMEDVARSSQGAIGRRAVELTLEHTATQFSATTERSHRHVDAERLRALDGRAIDQGTPDEDAETIDVADFAVLFELQRLRTGAPATRRAALETYDLVVVDEAQEFVPLELAVIGLARRAGGSVTVAGDEQQRLDDAGTFASWDASLAELGADAHETLHLVHSYRCPAPVEAFARGLVRDEGRPSRDDPSSPSPAPLLSSHFDHPCHLCSVLVDALGALRLDEPRASIAVICRNRASATALEAQLARGLPTRLVIDGTFDFRPGISVTCVDEVKGLEFDYVVVPDLTASSYPDTPADRRALYVACTRASYQLWLCATGAWSPLRPPDPDAG